MRTTFKITDAQFNDYFDTIRDKVSSSGNLGDTATAFGLTATHFVAGVFISLFALFFFLYEGPRIWAWVVRLFPRTARDRVDSSAVIAWDQLSAFVRATMIVAFVDAVGIGVGAAILKVPFAFAIGILVFLLAFIPIVGALLSGFVAVVLALVAHGPGVALIMLAVVIGVQQLESHVLQPFLLGKAVSVHPLAVILAIAIGSITAGIVGALVAVPFAAVINAVGKHLLIGESREELDDELEERAHQGRIPSVRLTPRTTKRPEAAVAPGRFVVLRASRRRRAGRRAPGRRARRPRRRTPGCRRRRPGCRRRCSAARPSP